MSAVEETLHPLCSLAVHLRRAPGPLVGRQVERDAIEQELAAAASRLSCVTLEGEPGIGKTRLLVAAAESAEERGFTTIAVTADEELRGPFLLARSIFASASARKAAADTSAERALSRATDAISGRDEPGLEGLAADEKLLRTFDLAAVAVDALAAERPLAILVDDLQWADDDSLRLLRYVVRADATDPVFLLFSIRPEETAVVTEAVTLLADLGRMGLVRRLRLERFTQQEATELLEHALGAGLRRPSVATINAQAEGVPFILEEIASTYRDAGMIQQIDGVWALAKNAERLVPSSVRTLIQRRSARLPGETRALLGEAAVLGRSFSLRDLAAIGEEGERDPAPLGEVLAPAVETGLLLRAAADSPADFSFSHNEVRELCLESLPAHRRQAIHAAVVDMLVGEGDPSPASLPLLAHHSLAAGDGARAARFSVEAARYALESHAPEEVLRLVDVALPVASAAGERLALLTAKDGALEMLHRPGDRLEGLAQLSALADALGDSHLELEVMSRRAAATRLVGEGEQAAALARRVRDLAVERGDRKAELTACLELGQALLGAPIGDGYVQTTVDGDLDGAEEAYSRAEELARELGDEAATAAVVRELGVIAFSRAVHWFVGQKESGEYVHIMFRAAAGESPEEIVPTLPVANHMRDAESRFREALERYERLGDRRGVMSSVIGLAYTSFGPDIHFGPTAARRIEEIRRLASQLKALSKESEREPAEVQMLYGVHVFARAKVIPDLAISRGEEAHRRARLLGDRDLEFASAAGTGLAHLDLGEVEEARRWLDRAAEVAVAEPSALRSRRLELARGLVQAAAGDAEGMQAHFERAVAMGRGRASARAEALSRLALESARLGAQTGDEELVELGLRSAAEAKAASEGLPGHPPWPALADAALTHVAHARGDGEAAAASARNVLGWFKSSYTDDWWTELMIPASRALQAFGTPEEVEFTRGYIRASLAMAAQRILDEDVRIRWFRGPVGRAMSELAGGSPPGGAPTGNGSVQAVDDPDAELLRLLTEGLSNRGIGERLGVDETEVRARLGALYGRIGASSRGDATAFAFRERVV